MKTCRQPAPAIAASVALAAALAALAGAVAGSQATGSGYPDLFGFGTPVSPAEVEAFNIRPAIPPDGSGLPPGSGTVEQGFEVYQFKCASCHGPEGNDGPYDVLVGREPLTGENPRKTVGNYWPYATTLFDYIYRAMPFNEPGSLEPDEVYALVAWILYANGIVDEGQVMDEQTLPRVKMPAEGIFVPDPRPREPQQ